MLSCWSFAKKKFVEEWIISSSFCLVPPLIASWEVQEPEAYLGTIDGIIL